MGLLYFRESYTEDDEDDDEDDDDDLETMFGSVAQATIYYSPA